MPIFGDTRQDVFIAAHIAFSGASTLRASTFASLIRLIIVVSYTGGYAVTKRKLSFVFSSFASTL